VMVALLSRCVEELADRLRASVPVASSYQVIGHDAVRLVNPGSWEIRFRPARMAGTMCS